MRSIAQTIPFLALTVLLSILFPNQSRGGDETLFLRDGRALEGSSLGIESGLLRWQTRDGERFWFPFEEIDRIEYPAPEFDISVAALLGYEPALPDIPPAPGETAIPNAATGVSPILSPASPGRYESAFGRFGARVDDVFKYGDSWTKRFEVGGRVLRGNTDEDFLSMGLKFEKKSEHRFAQIESGGQLSTKNGDPTSNRWFVNGTIDFNKQTEERWVWFATSKNEYDEFENLSYRGSLSTGLGYRFYKEPTRRLITRIGPGVTHERFYGPFRSRTTPDLFGEIEVLWPLFDRTSFEHTTSIYPSTEDIQVFRFVSTYGLLIGIDESKHWSLKLGLRHEYNSQPNDHREKSDYTASFTLVYTRN